jgi:creatinine amidohydrolase
MPRRSSLYRIFALLVSAGLVLLTAAAPVFAQKANRKLSVHWEELTAEDFVAGIHQSGGTCLLPIGILEKHGEHLPIGNDLINARWAALHAAERNYAVVFPAYYIGQISEARHQPGTIAYPAALQMTMLQATTDEMARNGCKKIVIVNGHGGNENWLPYFAQSQLDRPHDYVVYVFGLPRLNVPGRPRLQTSWGGHADEAETSHTMISRPDLVHLDRAGEESGADLNRLKGLPRSLYTGIWWYAKFPNHYAGDARPANTTLGQFDMNTWVNQLDQAITAVKNDSESLKLQNEFYEKSSHPLDTKQ